MVGCGLWSECAAAAHSFRFKVKEEVDSVAVQLSVFSGDKM